MGKWKQSKLDILLIDRTIHTYVIFGGKSITYSKNVDTIVNSRELNEFGSPNFDATA